jgi:hypothetical protein
VEDLDVEEVDDVDQFPNCPACGSSRIEWGWAIAVGGLYVNQCRDCRESFLSGSVPGEEVPNRI